MMEQSHYGCCNRFRSINQIQRIRALPVEQELLRTVQAKQTRRGSNEAPQWSLLGGNMRNHLSSAAAGILLLAGVSAAAAQDVVVIQPEQDTVIREYVKKKPMASVSLLGVELNIGTALPDTVELYEVPDVQYRYVVVDGRTVLVDPSTRKIVKVYD
ncbi:uncharacterized protein DUF1236 [Mesorhizobium tianshanense]|uniref:Uncharacterized protein DUF1236 n=2 Tax=Mesorhizobium tianshanense TaxID=39844 RepID=A0A562P3V6_9HYPH|nr:uncharacterized protein DUF1236 [Mesorhizobium tianshanense]